jgi:hypothetical protein
MEFEDTYIAVLVLWSKRTYIEVLVPWSMRIYVYISTSTEYEETNIAGLLLSSMSLMRALTEPKKALIEA